MIKESNKQEIIDQIEMITSINEFKQQLNKGRKKKRMIKENVPVAKQKAIDMIMGDVVFALTDEDSNGEAVTESDGYDDHYEEYNKEILQEMVNIIESGEYENIYNEMIDTKLKKLSNSKEWIALKDYTDFHDIEDHLNENIKTFSIDGFEYDFGSGYFRYEVHKD